MAVTLRGRIASQRGGLVVMDEKSEADEPSLPIDLYYLAEGGANILWSFQKRDQLVDDSPDPPEAASLSNEIQRMLLRVRKDSATPAIYSHGRVTDAVGQTQEPSVPASNPSGDVTRTQITGAEPSSAHVSTEKIFQVLSQEFRPALAPYCLEHKLIYITPKIRGGMAEALKNLESSRLRPQKRAGTYIDRTECFALLVADMRPRSPNDIMVHFKPKWLAQSPSAPTAARRCRTCALAACRGRRRTNDYCPLALQSASRQQRHGALVQIFAANGVKNGRSRVLEAVVDFFDPSAEGGMLLARLREKQEGCDPKGICAMAERDEGLVGDLGRLQSAMTLRDCSLYLRVEPCESGELRITARLGDLDFKGADAKRKTKWLYDERRLIEGGWYEGIEELEAESQRETGCLLWN